MDPKDVGLTVRGDPVPSESRCRDALGVLRRRRRQAEVDIDGLDDHAAAEPGPGEEALWVESVGPALLVVLDRLSPAQRVAFVLHDLFAMPFEDIAVV
ncbi:sigma factor-like helix-turn-helix DNA-binding protein [Williamsia sp.]|uniref:sigma factor-like helix-turn-helix DNA-binding protein n=1 Tax=Williamsia sp. TaxID=1872085 RepID=UPI002F94BBD3